MVPPPATKRPVPLQLRTYGFDLHRARYGQPPRQHTLTKKLLRKLTVVELANTHDGCLRGLVEAMKAGDIDDALLAIVKAQRLHVELACRLVRAEGEEPHIVIDDRPLADRG